MRRRAWVEDETKSMMVEWGRMGSRDEEKRVGVKVETSSRGPRASCPEPFEPAA
jgi:hypothetical protein